MPERDLEERIRKLNRIGVALTSETNLERLLNLVVREVRGFTRADAGSLYIRDGESLRFEVAQNDSLDRRKTGPAEPFRPFPIPLTRTSIAGFVALTGKVLNIVDVYELADSVEFSFNQDFDRRNEYRSQSMLVAPMIDHRHETIGVLQLINPQDSSGRVIPFSQDMEALVLSLASQAAVAIRNARLISDMKSVFAALVRYSASAIDARSPHTAGHSRRVAALCLRLAQAVSDQTDGPFADVRFTREELEELSYAAWLHDIGKIGVREEVLEKTTKLDPTGMALVRARFQHAQAAQNAEALEKLVVHGREISPGADAWDRYQSERAFRQAEYERNFDFLERINQPGWLGEADLAHLYRLSEIRFPDGQGRPTPLLTDDEVAHLGVRQGNLTPDEYQEIKSHVLHTRNIVGKIPFTPELARIPLFAAAHHERMDGTGYPEGLAGPAIPLQARILGVADIMDALVASDRPYKKALTVDRAVAVLREEAAAGRLDADLVALVADGAGVTQEWIDSISRDPNGPRRT